MKASDKKRVIEFYDRKVAEHGYSPDTLGWNKRRHELRYDVLVTHWDLTGRRVLDFGCGFGDMYGYMRKRGIAAQYEGIDINDNVLAEGRRVYPDATLVCRDAFADGLPATYDYVLSSGVHNFRLENNEAFIKDSFELFNAASRCGFALNFISDRVGYREDHLNYTDPSMVLSLAYDYSNRVTLRNDYMPWEFTLFVDKRTDFDPDKGVYPDFADLVP